MPRPPSPFSIRPSDGGKLVTVASAENVGIANYTEKTNWIRIDDVDERRHGTLYFKPNAALPDRAQYWLPENIVGLWEATRPNGERAVVAASRNTIYRYTYETGAWTVLGSGFSSAATKWEGETIDGYLILNNAVDLLVYYRVEDTFVKPLKEMRDIGISCVGTIAVDNGFLLCGDVTEIISTQLTAWMNGGDPYGVVPANLCNRIRYKIAWPDYNAVTNWSPVIRGTILATSKNIVTLDYVGSAFTPGTKIAVIGAGINGGTLGGELGFETGVPITAQNGNDITLGESADAGLTYPLTVQVTRWTDVSTFAGSSSIQDDSSAIIRMIPLKRVLIVYRETGIFSGRYTAQVETPWVFTPEYKGANIPEYPQAIVSLQGDAHIFPTKNQFYMFDGTGDPRCFTVLDNARTLFFDGLDPSTAQKAFAVHNPVTKELWFFCPNGVLAYNYNEPSVEWIDETYGAAAFIRTPDGTTKTDPSKFWFILSKANNVLQYGATADDGAITYLRLGVPMVNSLSSGVIALGDDMDEKQLQSYAPLAASDSPQAMIEVTLYGKDSASQAFDVLCSEVLTDPNGLPLIETFFRNVYFKDRIRVVDTRDVNFRLSGRNFYFTHHRSLGSTRNFNGNA